MGRPDRHRASDERNSDAHWNQGIKDAGPSWRRRRPVFRHRGTDAGKVAHQLIQLADGPGAQHLPRALVELFGGQPASPEMLAELREDRVTIGVARPELRRRDTARTRRHCYLPFPASRLTASGAWLGVSPASIYCASRGARTRT